MITKKVCLLGGVCVGKTSLARRYVYSSFSDDYHSTIGVKIHKKSLQVNDLVSFLKGLSGYLLVVDVTRPESVEVATALRDRVNANFGKIPYVLVFSKCDLPEHPATRESALSIQKDAIGAIDTSSLTGDGVDTAFLNLASELLSVRKAG